MSGLVIVLNELNKDIEVYCQLLVEAEVMQDYVALVDIEEKLAEMKDQLAVIEGPEINRKRRIAQNVIWREFNQPR